MYNVVSSYTINTDLQTSTQALSVTEDNNSTLTPILPWSFSGTTRVVYNLQSYNGANIPSFVSLNSSSGVLSVSSPIVSSSTDYSFTIVSTIQGVLNQIQNVIRLTIKKWTASNCKRWAATDSSVCTNCNSGYNLDSGAWKLPESNTAKSLSISSQVSIAATIGLSFAFSFTNFSSVASLWSMINQMQIFLEFYIFKKI